MLTKIRELKRNLDKVDSVNTERMRQKTLKDTELNELYNKRDDLRLDIETLKFIVRSSAEYYTDARKKNLETLEKSVGEFMTSVLEREYDVKLGIKRNGNYDYLDISVNGLEPKDLSGGEKQVFSLSMVSECSTSGVLVLDETINSLDPHALEKIVYYLEKIGEDKQVFIIELDDNLEIPHTYIVEGNTIQRGNLYE